MKRSLSVALLLAASLRAENVRLVEPRDGAPLDGGSRVAIAWSGDTEAEEWEAFLSVDGGRTFATRITPHLDARITRFTFEVPDVATNDARILLRFGDEIEEEEVAIPSRFSIRFDSSAVRTRIVTFRDERGDRGATMWVAGERDGSSLRTFVQRTSALRDAEVAALQLPPVKDADTTQDPAAIAHPTPAPFAPASASTPAPRARAGRNARALLLETRRLNI